MKRDIIIAVVSSLVTLLITLTVGNVLHILNKVLSESEIKELARVVVDTPSYRDVLLDKMELNRRFEPLNLAQGDINRITARVIELEKQPLTERVSKLEEKKVVEFGSKIRLQVRDQENIIGTHGNSNANGIGVDVGPLVGNDNYFTIIP